jgi:hypothetical protein
VQLSDVLALTTRRALERHTQKRAGVMLPLAVGAMIPSIVERALERAHSTEHAVDEASLPKTAALPMQLALPLAQLFHNPKAAAGAAAGAAGRGAMGAGQAIGGGLLEGAKGSLGEIGAAPGKGVAHGLSSLVEKKLFGRELGERQDTLGIGGGAAAKAFGAEAGKAGFGLLRDMAAKAVEAVGHAGDQAAREAIVGKLKKTDSVLAGADDATLMGAYHSMTRFAPVLSTDENAVRSFLRQAVMTGAGPDYMSIKLLADAERAVTGGGDKRAAEMSHDQAIKQLLEMAAEQARKDRPTDILKSTALGGLTGAGMGALGGALSDDKHRARGALIGGGLGGALGAGGGALSEWLFPQPKAYELQPIGERTHDDPR